MPWFIALADLLASEYGWSRQEVWWEVSMPEVALYVRAIVTRKMRENGQENEIPMDDRILNVLEVIETVMKERNNARL